MQRPNRYLERSGSMKRGLDPGDGDDAPDPKRPKVPALASVIVEALKVDSLQKLCSSLEPILRRVVSEEVERALAKLGPARLGGRSSPKRIEGPDGRSLQLHFRSRLSLPLFTGGKVEGEQGAAIHVVLLDANTGHVVTSGPEASAKLDVVVLEGDFNNEDDDDWTEEDFESHVVKEREGKRPLLTGDVQVSLKEGVGTLGELTFTDNSSWIRSRKFRLGMKIAAGFCDEIRVREAKTEAFTVKDHRGELYKKHYPPVLKDEVWRLEKIGKDGSFHKRLNKAGIYTVEDFLKLVVRDSQRLRNILGSGMSNKMWECLVEHSKTCVVIEKYYVYYSDDTRNIGAIFNNIYEFSGLIYGGQYYSAEFLTDSQKVFADTLVKKAYDNWMHVIEFDGTAPLNLKQSKKTTSHNDIPSASANYSVPYDQQAPPPHQHVTVPSEQSSVVTHSPVGGSVSTGYNGHQVHRYTNHPQSLASHPNIQFESQSFAPQGHLVGSSHQSHITRSAPQGQSQGQLVGSSHQTHITRSAPQGQLVGSSHQTHITRSDSTGLALGPPQQSSSSYQSMAHNIQTPNLHTYDDWSRQRDVHGVDEYFTEEEIRMRSHEMLENDDMQHLLRVLSTGGTANLPEDGYGFPSYMPSPFPDFNFDEDRSKTSGKAVVGWLKIKAAMRWGIFIRKKAAEKRAQLVELEESSQEY